MCDIYIYYIMKKSKKAIKRKSSTKKVKSKKNSDKIIKVNFDVIVRKSPLKYTSIKCNNKCRSRLYESPIVEKIPKEITKFIQKQKKEITNYLFYDFYKCCGVRTGDGYGPGKECPLCKKDYPVFPEPEKISFNSTKKIMTIEYILPKGSKYNDIKKTIMYPEFNYGAVELAANELDLYKIKNNYYHMDWKFKNLVIPDYYKK